MAGIRSHHSFVPNSPSKLEMRRTSDDYCFTTVFLGEQCIDTPQLPDLNVVQPGKYNACMYDERWYIGNIEERSDEHNDLLVNFMRIIGTTLSWPVTDDKCWVPLQEGF